MPRTSTLAALLVLALATPGAVMAQDGPDAPVDLPMVEEPPELADNLRTRFDRSLKRLRNSNAEKRAKTEQEIVEYGRGAIPGLIDKLHTDHEGLGEGLVTCLTELVDLRDRELVASHATSEHVYARAFSARAGGKLGLGWTLKPLEQLLEDERLLVRVEAALALVRNGHADGLPVLALNFEDERPRVLAALPGIKNHGDHGPLLALLRIDEKRQREEPDKAAAERRAAVSMLRAIADVPAVRALGESLNDPHNLVQREAIDAVREICEDKGPFSGQSIFQQLSEVKRLQAVAKTWVPKDD